MANNTFQLSVLGENRTLDLKVLPEITDSFWLNIKDEEIPKDDEGVQDIYHGEKVKVKLVVTGAEEGQELVITVKSQDDGAELAESEKQPFALSTKVQNGEALSEPFYIDPIWFDKENTVTYVFDVKLKEGDSVLAENLPEAEEKRLAPVGFGKPDLFKMDPTKGYSLERESNGKKTAYTGGKMEEIELYQSWFEDDSDELDTAKKVQIKSYFESVYMTRLMGWSPNNEYGNAANRAKIIAAFETASSKHGVPASIMFTYAAGEGMQLRCSRGPLTDINKQVQSFQAFGLDFFEEQAAGLKKQGYLSKSFDTKATALAEKYVDSKGKKYYLVKPVKDFKGGDYAIVRLKKGGYYTRSEAADGGKTVSVYPVVFKDLLTGIEGACAVYAKAYDDAQASSKKIGWGELTQNQKAFFGYVKIQKTSTKGNAELNRYRPKPDANFYDRKYSPVGVLEIEAIMDKSYRRYVAWRYIRLGKFFTE
ncbi:hypothetical protein [Maribacter sp. 2-571]|uniref:hypothetical protein n=1 Tax=Maribacter sp. 2-571 TaxID=3417569 RepID=UPI003D347680